jgi:hypothetical protein
MEARLIHNILDPLPGVRRLEVALVTKTVTISHDAALTPPAVLLAALNSAGLDASIGSRREAAAAGARLPPWHMLLAALLAALSLLSYAHHAGLGYTKWLALGSIAFGLPPFLPKAWASARSLTLDITILMVIAVAGAVALGDYVEAATIVILFSIAEWLESKCISRANSAITSILELQPETAFCVASGGLVPVESVAVGQLVLVRPGDKIPVDGGCWAGAGLVLGRCWASAGQLSQRLALLPTQCLCSGGRLAAFMYAWPSCGGSATRRGARAELGCCRRCCCCCCRRGRQGADAGRRVHADGREQGGGQAGRQQGHQRHPQLRRGGAGGARHGGRQGQHGVAAGRDDRAGGVAEEQQGAAGGALRPGGPLGRHCAAAP